ncbi:ATP-binding protein [Bacillus sp. N9]
MTRHISVFKDITELKEKTNQIKQLDKLGAVGQLAAGIAHEIRNPLTSVKGFVQLLSEETNSKYSQIITSEIERIEFIMNEFLVLAKPQQEMRLKSEKINNIVKDVISFMNPEALLHNVEIVKEFNEAPPVFCESKQIKQVIINMIKNAIEAMPIGGTIHIKTATLPNGYAAIEIIDEGIGIAKERLKRLREPFYSNKEKGTGLGVMICYKIIEDHGGTIQFTSKEGLGTKVQIFLPPATVPKNNKINNG